MLFFPWKRDFRMVAGRAEASPPAASTTADWTLGIFSDAWDEGGDEVHHVEEKPLGRRRQEGRSRSQQQQQRDAHSESAAHDLGYGAWASEDEPPHRHRRRRQMEDLY
jgi:hypothetical protein